jgi:hypothetical protein
MSKNKTTVEGRRNFLKASAAGAAGIMIAGAHKKAHAQNGSPWPATGYMQINPDIDNCRVVFLTDTSMLKRQTYNSFSDANNNAIDHDKVRANIDRMACALARKNTAAEAWPVIFRKPAAKSWAQVKVAMKVNANYHYSPCIGAVAKLCEVLNGFGVPYASMTVFDGGNASGSGCTDKYTEFKTKGWLPPVNVITRGDTYAITVPGMGGTTCVTATRDADIIITCAVNKGHDRNYEFGGVTMCLKNHVGTINFAHPGGGAEYNLTYLTNYHKHEAILGLPNAGVPVKQQLAFVDSTWVGQPGSWEGFIEGESKVLHTLVMGTFPGAVDYLTTKKIRVKAYPSETNLNWGFINRYMTDFGYTDAERSALDTMDPNADPQGRGLCEVGAAPIVTSRGQVDAKIGDYRAGTATQADVAAVIKKYRNAM